MTTTTYDLYLESGPRHKKTMTHVLALLGCVAVGPTTAEAVAATPDAIRAYLRFLRRHGEPVDPGAPFETRVVQHITEGDWLGNGSPYLLFDADLQPLSEQEIETYLRRFAWLRGELADWVDDLANPTSTRHRLRRAAQPAQCCCICSARPARISRRCWVA